MAFYTPRCLPSPHRSLSVHCVVMQADCYGSIRLCLGAPFWQVQCLAALPLMSGHAALDVRSRCP